MYVYVHEGLKEILGDLGEKTGFQARIQIKFHTSGFNEVSNEVYY